MGNPHLPPSEEPDRYPGKTGPTDGKGAKVTRQESGAMPIWVTITVVLTLLGLLVWNVIVNGNEGYPTSVILGGLLGAYGGAQELLKRRGKD